MNQPIDYANNSINLALDRISKLPQFVLIVVGNIKIDTAYLNVDAGYFCCKPIPKVNNDLSSETLEEGIQLISLSAMNTQNNAVYISGENLEKFIYSLDNSRSMELTDKSIENDKIHDMDT